jgi:hypothetical protein
MSRVWRGISLIIKENIPMSPSNSIASGPSSMLQNLTILHNEFQNFDTENQGGNAKADDIVSEDDLKAVVADGGKSGRFNQADVQAAQFFLDHPEALACVDTAAVSGNEPGVRELADDKTGQPGALGADGAGRSEALSVVDTLNSAGLLTDKELAVAQFKTSAASHDNVSLETLLAMPKQSDGQQWTPEDEGQVQACIRDALARHGGNVADAFADLRDLRQKPENYYDSNMAIAADYLRARWDVQRHGTVAEEVSVGAYLALKRAGGVPQEGPGPVSPYSDLEAKYMWKGVDDESRHQSFWDDLMWSAPLPVPVPLPLPLGLAKAGAETLLNFL